MNDAEVADHAFLDGRLLLREPRRGHRSGTDAVLLAAATRLAPGQHLMDVGSGAGAVALAALCRVTDATATLVERSPRMAALARHNLALNGFADRAEVVEVDIFDKVACRTHVWRRPDVVASNPPFYMAGEVRASANAQRAASHVLTDGDHGDWLRRMLDLADPHGRVVLINRPEALPSLIQGAHGRAALRLRSIHSHAGKPGSRILLEAARGRRSSFIIEPPLMLHEESGSFTPFADDLHRGRCWL